MAFKESHPIRVLHVLGGMNRGGVETWLMHILRHIDRDRFHMDFLVHTTEPCVYDDEIRSLGSKIIPCLDTSRPWLYAHNFKRILREYEPYDIVHSHVHHFSGYVLRLAKKGGVPFRIAHCHNDYSPLEANAGLYRRFYLTLMKGLIKQYATLGLGCSQLATVDLFGSDWKNNPRWRLFYYGIDMLPFREPNDSLEVRTKLGIPGNAFVIGHVGRFHKQKNHRFLLEIFALVAKREPQAYLLLLGEGSLRPDIEHQALQMGISDRIIFAGTRSDIPQLMIGAMDVFVLPSVTEGLPMVGIEAQAAGLPMILSDVITEEINKIAPLVEKISLSQPASVWADAVVARRYAKSNITQADSLAVLENSEFDIISSVKILTKAYADEHC
jgi:glycosyltransferase involved in cell wall biosynthesis